jgi:hypothetical protein
MTLYGMTCGYWTDDNEDRDRHYQAHRAAHDYLDAPIFLDEANLGGVEPPVLRGCARNIKTGKKRGAAARKAATDQHPGLIESPSDYLIRSWLDAEATHTKGGEPIEVIGPAPHPNEIATRQAAEAGLYPVVHDEDGNEIDPLTVVGAHDARSG